MFSDSLLRGKLAIKMRNVTPSVFLDNITTKLIIYKILKLWDVKLRKERLQGIKEGER